MAVMNAVFIYPVYRTPHQILRTEMCPCNNAVISLPTVHALLCIHICSFTKTAAVFVCKNAENAIKMCSKQCT
jgi:hypothetical protein